MHERLRRITIGDLVRWGRAYSTMSPTRRRMHFGTVCMDSRKVRRGDVFLALESKKNDGHKFVGRAIEKGACAAIVSRKHFGEYSDRIRSKLVAVSNPLKAVGKMASAYRAYLNIPIVAVTGSNGKTTTRRFIAKALAARIEVGESRGNWNNHIGVPLTILGFLPKHRIGVIELAANHVHEIAPLSRIARPDIAVITNIGYAHIGNFGTLSRTAETKFEVVKGFTHATNFLLLNGDDRRVVKKAEKLLRPRLFFGMSKRCDIRAYDIHTNFSTTSFTVDGQRYELQMSGEHFVYNALPAVYLARRFGYTPPEIAQRLGLLKPDSLRGRIKQKQGINFIVDCYNANPSSMQSAIKLLSQADNKGKTAAIVGDMLELGRYSRMLHRQLGARLCEAGIKKVIAVGRFSEYVGEGARKKAKNCRFVHTVTNAKEAVKIAKKILKPQDTVLLKASRAVELERVYNEF